MNNEIEDLEGSPGDDTSGRNGPAYPKFRHLRLNPSVRSRKAIHRRRKQSERPKPARRRASAGSDSCCSDTAGFRHVNQSQSTRRTTMEDQLHECSRARLVLAFGRTRVGWRMTKSTAGTASRWLGGQAFARASSPRSRYRRSWRQARWRAGLRNGMTARGSRSRRPRRCCWPRWYPASRDSRFRRCRLRTRLSRRGALPRRADDGAVFDRDPVVCSLENTRVDHWRSLWPMVVAGAVTIPFGVWLLVRVDPPSTRRASAHS